MKKKWDREEESASLVCSSHEMVLLDLAISQRIHALTFDRESALGEDSTGYVKELKELKHLIKVMRDVR